MKKSLRYRKKDIGWFFIHIGAALFILFIIPILFVNGILKEYTNHGKYVVVPDYIGWDASLAIKTITIKGLRYQISDSSFSPQYPPFTIIQQFPKSGSRVKPTRMIYLTLNKKEPPTVPIPNLIDQSIINAKVVLSVNDLRLGKVLYRNSSFEDLVLEMRWNQQPVPVGTLVPKGSSIDVVIGYTGIINSNSIVIGNLLGNTYEQALFKIKGWNLRLGKVTSLDSIDTIHHNMIVIDQLPKSNDSVRIGTPIHLWIAPQDEPENNLE